MNPLNYWVFGLCPFSGILKKTQHFGNWICFRSQVRVSETSILLGPLERATLNQWTVCKGPNRVVFPTLSPQCSLVLFRIPDDGQGRKKPSNSECYTPSLEPFRIYLY
jgi:hypothetical protein